MASLADIVALRETVDIRGTKITVRGLSVTAIGSALADSDDLQRFWAGRKFDAVSLLSAIPGSISRIVATAIIPDDPPAPADLNGFAGDGEWVRPVEAIRKSHEEQISANMQAFDELNAEEQLTIVEAIIRVSFPGGLSPFVDRLGRLAGRDNLSASLSARYGKAPDGSSPPLSTN